MKFKSILSNQQGTTLIEAVVSTLILSIGIIPSFFMILVSNNLSASIRNNLIAANLAQEGIEVARAIRDANWFASDAFDTGFTDGDYTVEWNSTSLTPVTGTVPLLKVDNNGLYNYTNGTNSAFSRKLTITRIDPTGCNCELKVISEVSWQEKKSVKTIRVESHLYNWP